MNTQKILKKLTYNDGIFPLEALSEAIENSRLIIPGLLEIITYARENAQKIIEQKIYMAHIYAMFLLAQFRENRAYPLIVDFFSLPEEIPIFLTGGICPGYLARILASVSCGEENLMKDLIEKEHLSDSVRIAALSGLAALAACREKSREEIMLYYTTLFQEKFARVKSQIWNGLVAVTTDLYPEELYEDIELAYKENLLEFPHLSLKEVQECLSLGKDKALAHLKHYHKYTLIEDTILEMRWWACFNSHYS